MARFPHPDDEMDPDEARARIARMMTILLGVYFLAGGAMRLLGPDPFVAALARWGYPAWFLYAVGAGELLGGLLVLVPRTTAFGGFVLTGMMAGAVTTHVAASQWSALLLPLALGMGTTLVAWHYAPARVRQALEAIGTSRPVVD